jgi:fructose-bisphosphate aldolase, class I
MRELLRDGKALFLACDQGFEHGPRDFNEDNVDPQLIIDLAEHGPYSGVILLPGTAAHYYAGRKLSVPLIVKLNSKTSWQKGDPISLQHCSVARAKALGAVAVGYTLYSGSQNESVMYAEFGRIIEEAHDLGMSVIAWAYPRGEAVDDPMNTNTIAYAARIAAELGADMVKLKYNGDREGFPWILKNALRSRVVVSGGSKVDEYESLTAFKEAFDMGAVGTAVGRNVWQNSKPWAFSEALGKLLFEGASVDGAYEHYRHRDA